jgi:hypothetical protein
VLNTNAEPTIHYSELPPSQPGRQLAVEWEFYRREVGRLIAEGHEGQYVLIKGEEVLGFWADRLDALEAGYRRFLLKEAFLVHRIQTYEILFRVRVDGSCPILPTR